MSRLSLQASIRSLRGFMQKLQLQAQQQLCQPIAPYDVTQYPILGSRQESTPTVMKGNDFLDRLCLKTLVELRDALHELLQQYPAEDGSLRRLHVGMSGGADSTLVLVLACAVRDAYGYEVEAIHCIHGLDPDDDIWLEHNKRLASKLNVSLVTPVLHIVYGNGQSPEEISRKERYAALLQRTDAKTGCLLLGHQADDQIENFLLALKRGSGPQGLAGMKMVTEDSRGLLVRPLLDLHKLEIEQILVSCGFDYVYDLSNSYMKFERNYMRLKVLPTLRKRFPGIDRSILRSQQLCRFEHEVAERYALEQVEKYEVVLPGATEHEWALDFHELDCHDEALVTMILRMFFKKHGFTDVETTFYSQALELLQKEHDVHGRLNVKGTNYKVSTFKQYLCVYNETSLDTTFADTYTLQAGESLTIGQYCYTLERKDGAGAEASTNKSEEIFTLIFNTPSSFKIKLKGAPHSTEVKKLFLARNVAPWWRQRQPLVMTTGEESELVAVGSIAWSKDFAYRVKITPIQ